jgi:hypothetical protein
MQALYAEEAHRPPRGKRASWSGNKPIPNSISIATKVAKTALKIKTPII